MEEQSAGTTRIRQIQHHLRTFLIGAAMGVANIIPGVSGGTIAVVFGIYEDLMEALGNFITDKKNRGKYILFLAVLFFGALVAIFSLASVLKWAFTHYPLPTVYFFIGLILGSIPVVIKSHSDMKFSVNRLLAFILGVAVVIFLALMQKSKQEMGTTVDFSSYAFIDYIYLFFCGTISASAMIIPGVSGSFLLILLGVYWAVLSSISGLFTLFIDAGFNAELQARILILSSLGIGIVLGILVIARIMSWALKKYPAPTMYVILGLIVGSVYQIYPGFEFNFNGFLAVVTFVIGMIVSLKFGVEKKHIA
jgi:putative membrane protein